MSEEMLPASPAPPQPPPPPPPPPLPVVDSNTCATPTSGCPPPPLPFSSQLRSDRSISSDKKGIVQECVATAEEQITKAYRWFLQDHGLTQDQLGNFVFLAGYRPVKPVIQNGPLCGMVALAMAAQLVGQTEVTTEAIFQEAKSKDYSLQGEMFSVVSMQQLAASFLGSGCETQILSWSSHFEARHLIIKALLQHQIMLLPYDADRNHGPCKARGHKAHWALVTGFFAVINKDLIKDYLLSGLTPDAQVSNLYHISDLACVEEALVRLLEEKGPEFQLLMHQGKSKHCGVWRLGDMIESNDNLMEVGPDRDGGDYLLPSGGIGEGLRRTAVLIRPVCKTYL